MTVSIIEPPQSPRELFYSVGLVVLPGLFTADETAQLRASAEHVRDGFHRHIDTNRPGWPDSNCMRHVEEPMWHPDTQQHRIALTEFACDPRLVGPVEQVLQGRSVFGCSSLFIHPRRTSADGPWHRDLQYLYPNDEEEVQRRVRLEILAIQLQVALVDSDDIEYVPYSPTRYDSPEELAIRVGDGGANASSEMPFSMRVRLRAGDGVMFNPNGLHRGRYHSHIPRLTLMHTYTRAADEPVFDDFRYQPWLLDPAFMDGLSPRAQVYVQDAIERYRPFWAGPALESPFR